MYDEKLFLGIPLDGVLASKLKNINPEIRALFLNGGDYLQEWNEHGQKYLGKIIPSVSDLPSLELLNSNVISLIQRLLPEFQGNHTELSLLAIIEIKS